PATENPKVRPHLLSYANSKATKEEVAAAQALHRINGCLGEEIFVFPFDDGSLLVQGLVDEPSRRQAVEQSLSALKLEKMQIQIYTPHEIKPHFRLYPSPDGLSDGTAAGEGGVAPTAHAGAAAGDMPMHDPIYKVAIASGRSPDEAEGFVSKFSDEITGEARALLLHAWALKRLDAEFATPRIELLPAGSRAMIEAMQADHERAMRQRATRMLEMLQGIRPKSPPDGPVPEPPDPNSPRDVLGFA